jgi:hypothetical protein
VLLSGRGSALLCEELALRARLDLDAGRLALAAIELERAYAAALAELPGEGRGDLRPLTGTSERIEELEELRPDVEKAARAAVPVAPLAAEAATETTSTPTTATGVPRARAYARGAPDLQTVRHALERLEAALRARTALGFSPPS